jgi:enoyl-[acyl-carrier protein] reductase II
MKTKITEMLKIKYPIFQGGMAWLGTAKLAAAVSEAGGLGIIGAGNMEPDMLRDTIRKAKSLTDKPIGVNIYLLSEHYEKNMMVAIEEKVQVVTTGAGNPGKFVKKLKDAGIFFIPVVASDSLAKRMEKLGADALIAEGMEAGGHIGEVTTFALTPQIVDSVNIPVVAAGGIGDGRGLLAALSLGAEGVQVGTRFVASEECEASEIYKGMVVNAGLRGTAVTGTITGHPVRVLKNKLAKTMVKLEKEGNVAPEDFEKLGVGALRKAFFGDKDEGSFMAGQIAGLIKEVKPVKEIIESMVEEAEKVYKGLEDKI